MSTHFVVRQEVPQEILDAGDWMAEQLGIPRKQVFRTYTSASLVAAHRAGDPGLAERHDDARELGG
jgi:hypothetical protein